MLEGALRCSACGEPIPRTSRLQDDGTHICPACGERVDALPRFLGAGRAGADTGERTDDPITMPAIPASAFEPAVPVAFTGKHRWKPRKGGPAFVDPDDEQPADGEFEPLRPDPTPAYERVSHEIEAPAPPPVLRADSIPPIPDPEPEPEPEPEAAPVLDVPKIRPPRSRDATKPRPVEAPPRVEAREEAPDPRPRRPPSRSRPPPEAPAPQRRVDTPAAPSSAPPTPRTARPTPAPVAARGGPGATQAVQAPALPAKPPVAAPQPAQAVVEEQDGSEAYTVTEAGGALLVEWRWFGVPAIVLGFVASGWTGLLTGWLAIAGYLGSSGGLWLVLLALGGGVHLLLAAVVCYVAVASFVNRTRVRVSGGGIEVSVGPLPWRGGRSVPVAAIARLALTERTWGRHKAYDLAAVLAQGAQVPIVRGRGQLEEAKRLEELVARYLGNPMLRGGAKRTSAGATAKKTG